MKTAFLFAAVFLLVSEALILRKPTKPGVEVDNGYKTYSGYSVIRVIPHTDDQIKAVVQMEKLLGFEPDFWKPPKALKKSIDIMVSPGKRAEVTIYLKKAGMVPIIKIADVGKHVAADKLDIDGYQPNQNLATDPDSFDFYTYHPFSEIMAYIEGVATKYSSFVSIASLGKSFEGRDMKFLKIGYPSKSKKNALFIDAGIRAREWIAPATALYTINQLVTNSSFTDLLKAIDIYIVPSINPDGYEYSRSRERLWRKSRSGPRQGCHGADINRNFAYKWMVSGASTNPCSETYAGPNAMSEIEAKNLANFIVPHNDTIKAYLTLHSYGEYILYPWGYTTGTYPPDVADLKALGREMYNAIIAIHGTQYLVGSSGDNLDPSSGASDDYSKSVGVKYVYTVELRPGHNDNDDEYGFELPAKFIKPTAEEAFPGLLAAANRVQNGPF